MGLGPRLQLIRNLYRAKNQIPEFSRLLVSFIFTPKTLKTFKNRSFAPLFQISLGITVLQA